MNEKLASVIKSDCTGYPRPPFHPAEHFSELGETEIDKTNKVYGLVRELLFGLGMDKENYGTSDWNPFKMLVKPNDKVVIKPNLVIHSHKDGRRGIEAMVTHASILRPVIDYILIASNGMVKITVADVPLQSASWEKIINENHYEQLIAYYKNKDVNIELLDFRLQEVHCNKYGFIDKKREIPGDPKGNCSVDLGNDSCFMPIIKDHKKFTVTDYKHGSVGKHHNSQKNEHLIPRTILECDLFINIPKMKTHKKGGVTLSMKNLIGINADKSWIAHHRRGSVKHGGDEYDSLPLRFLLEYRFVIFTKRYKLGVVFLTYFFSPLRNLASFIKDKITTNKHSKMIYADSDTKHESASVVTEGSWYRNNTIWRSIIDLNRTILFADRDGKMSEKRQRKYFALVDGIKGMDRNGPMHGIPKDSSCLVAAYNPVVCDYVSSLIMGIDPVKIPSINECFKLNKYKIIDFNHEEIAVKSNVKVYEDIHNMNWEKSLKFVPADNWKGHIEKK